MSAPWKERLPRQVKADPISPEVKRLVRKRSGGHCEVCDGPAQHYHHRQLRRAGDHSAANLLHVCLFCHKRIHGHVQASVELGYIVSQYSSPAEVPVEIGGEWYVLSETGAREVVLGPIR